MGMDIYGNKAENEKGEYFRNNVWWWRPLANYILAEHFEIASSCDTDEWHSNSGGGLDGEQSLLLAKALRNDLETGRVAEYERQYNEFLSTLVREHCHLCEGTGIRTDKIGVEMEMPTKALSPEMVSLTGRSHGTCNACGGVGTKENFNMSYPFTEDNVKEFTEFLTYCGGFRIC